MMISTYVLVMLAHIISMIGLFIGYGLEWVGTAFLRESTTAEQARGGLNIYRTSLPLSGPALLVLLLTGFYMAGVTRVTKEGWVVASLLAIVVALAIGFAVVMPRMRSLRTALPEGSIALTGAALDKVQDGVTVTLIRVRFFLALGIVCLMILKPALITSLAVLFGAIIVGILSSATGWSKSTSA